MGAFSLAERDRRWTAVRSMMDLAGIDILVAHDRPNSRYLAQLDEPIGPTIFSAAGAVTAYGGSSSGPGASPERWVEDIRPLEEPWAWPVVERLRELRADGAIVGITGLDSLLDGQDGDLNYNSFVALREYLSHTRWVGASSLLREARSIKSLEEVARLGEAAAAAGAGLRAALAGPLSQTSDIELWARALAAMTIAGGEPPTAIELTVWTQTGARGPRWRPSGQRFEAGVLLGLQMAAPVAGYAAPQIQPAAVGGLSSEWKEAWQLHLEAWQRTWGLLRPGVELERLLQAGIAPATGSMRVEQRLFGAGLGDDLPLIMGGLVHGTSLEGPILQEGACFLLSPTVIWTSEGVEKQLAWGDTIVVGAAGARRLGSHTHELVIAD